MKRKLLSVLALAAVAVMMTAMASADTLPTLVLYDVGTGTTLVVADGSANDSCAALGCVTYNGTWGNFEINVDTGTSFPALAPNGLDLTYNATNTAGATDTMVIYLSTINNTANGLAFGEIAGTGIGNEWAAGWSQANTNCTSLGCPGFNSLWDHTLGPSPYGDTGQASISATGPYALVAGVSVTAASGKGATGDLSLHVPEPASLSLLGFGLIGLGGLRRKLLA